MTYNFAVDRSKIIKRESNAGEDAPPISSDGVLIVCDGTGATGQSKHEIDGESYTSAYLGSRQTSLSAKRFLECNRDNILNSISNKEAIHGFTQELGNAIRNDLESYVEKHHLKLTVRGKSFRMLPTTFVAAVYRIYYDHVELVAFSAGDSRILLWDRGKGLQQLSIDDIDEGYDAFSDVSNTNNCISADNTFRINYAIYKDIPAQGIVFATSDGFTDPIKPFDQERYLLQWMGKSRYVLGREKSTIEEDIGAALDSMGFTKKDDCSIAGVIYGYESDEELRADLSPRFSYVAETYVKPYYQLDKDCKGAMDEYNSAGSEKRKLTESVRSQIQKKLLECAQLLLPENYSKQQDVYDFLASQSCINNEIISIREESTKKMERAKEQFNLADLEVKKAYIEMLKQYSFIALKNGTDIGLPPNICYHLKTYMETKESKSRVCASYNSALQRIRSLPDCNENALVNLPVSDISNMCTSLSSSAADLNRIISETVESERTIDDFFSIGNRQITEMFERDKRNNFSAFDRYIDSLRPARGNVFFSFNFFGGRDRDDGEPELKKLSSLRSALDRAHNNAIVAQRKIDDATVTNEERVNRYKTVIKSHMNELMNAIFESPSMFLFFSGMSKNDFDSKIQSSDIVSNRAKQLIEQKNALWKRYKTSYERFLEAVHGHVEISRWGEF